MEPTATVEQAAGQADPTNSATVHFTATFSENVTGFADADVTLGGTAGATTAVVTGGPAVYDIAVSGMTGDGTVIASIDAAVAKDALGKDNQASTSVDNTVTYDGTSPTVTVEQAAGQADPTNGATIHFTATFGENVTGFAAVDVTLGGTAGATTAVVTGGPQVYDIAVSGMVGDGTVTASILAAVAKDAADNDNQASTSVDNPVTYDGTSPTATVQQAAGQADPSNGATIHFTATFSENVTGFANADVTLGGTAGATTAVVSGGPAVYDLAVSGMTGDGTVIASIHAAVAKDAAGNDNQASTSVDNSVTYDTTAPTIVNVTSSKPNGEYTVSEVIPITVQFSEPVKVTGTPRLTLETGAIDRAVSYASGDDTNTLTFTYTVQTGDTSADLDYIAGGLTLSGGTIKDLATNDANLTTLPVPGAAGSLGSNKAIEIDTTAPTVLNVTSSTPDSPPNYHTGAHISGITVQFSKPVFLVGGTLNLDLNAGNVRTITYSSGSGTDTLTFSDYVVVNGDIAGFLDYVSTGSLTLTAGTLRDAVGNNAVLTLPAPATAGSLGANKSITIITP
jgi:alpha-ketoglutarate-dependent taurine dioxygenase